MKKEFEYIYDEKKYNYFELNDFISILKNKDNFSKLQNTWGLTQESRCEYENKNALPPGSFDFIMLLQDNLFKEKLKDLQLEISNSNGFEWKANKNVIGKISALKSIMRDYPNAIRFLARYNSAIRKFDKNQYNVMRNKYYEEDICLVPLLIDGVIVVVTVGVALVAAYWLFVVSEMGAAVETLAIATEALAVTQATSTTNSSAVTNTSWFTNVSSFTNTNGGGVE